MATLVPHYMSSANSSDQSERSSPGPLRSLRLSTLSPDSGHVHGKHKSANLGKSSVKKSYSKQIRAKRVSHDPGFEFDVRFPVTNTGFASAPDPPPASQYGDSQLATIFANTVKSARAKYNIIDSLNPKDLPGSSASPTGTPVVVSPAARRRADAVKSALELKFTWIRKVQDVGSHEEHSYPGSDGCYNPLQVLRNRATRKKLGHPPPRTPPHPLPCDAFSTHFSRGAKSWKMLWGIDFDEIVADYAWRRVFWSELRNARGELWYPEAAARHNSQQTAESRRKISQRLHDKLWNDSDSDQIEDPGNMQGNASTKGKKSNWKEKAKRLYGSSASAVDLTALGSTSTHHASSKSVDGISGVKFSRLGKNTSVDETHNSYQFQFARSGDLENFLNTDFSQTDVLPPQIVVDSSSSNPHSGSDSVGLNPSNGDAIDLSVDNINDVVFNPAHTKQPSVQHLEQAPEKAVSIPSKVEKTPKPQAGPDESVADDLKLREAHNSIKLLEAVSYLSTNYLSVVYPQLLGSTTAKFDSLMQDRMQGLLWSISQTNAASLPARENLYRGFIEEAKSITHLANAECAVKIDNLLSTTDRSYSELNTSLIMELRKTNEKLDDLGRSLFSGVIGNSVNDEVARDYITDHKLLYNILENVIVVFLRLVWIGVNVFKPVLIFLRLLWKLVSLLVVSLFTR